MKVTVFLEGSPGHEKQSLSILEAMQEMTDLDVEKIHLKKMSPLKRIVSTLGYFNPAVDRCEFDVSESDVLLGTGSSTHIPLLSCKKKYNIPAVTCMAPDLLFRKHFDLCCIPRHDGVKEAPNILFTEGPPVFKCRGIGRDENAGLILLGGIDASSHAWNDDEIVSHVSDVISSSGNIKWNVSSSPRTPESTIEPIRKIAQTCKNVVFYHYKDTPSGWVEEQYALATYAWVTADSMSMIYEAITAGCCVGVLPVAWKKPNNKFQLSIERLIAHDFVTLYDKDAGLTLQKNGLILNEAARCAREILARFG